MSDETPDSLIPYDEIVHDALRAVVGNVLTRVAEQGLPGDHHFYITFKTRAPGVEIPPHLLERFPDEMPIVLQRKFWDLKVEEEGFSVGLSFNGVPAHLFIPFQSICAFVDPAVNFGLQFKVVDAEGEPEPHDDPENDGSDKDANGAASDGNSDDDDDSNVVSVDFGKKK